MQIPTYGTSFIKGRVCHVLSSFDILVLQNDYGADNNDHTEAISLREGQL